MQRIKTTDVVEHIDSRGDKLVLKRMPSKNQVDLASNIWAKMVKRHIPEDFKGVIGIKDIEIDAVMLNDFQYGAIVVSATFRDDENKDEKGLGKIVTLTDYEELMDFYHNLDPQSGEWVDAKVAETWETVTAVDRKKAKLKK